MNICILLIMVYQIPHYHSNEFNFELLDISKLKLSRVILDQYDQGLILLVMLSMILT